jgi:hypothetical protein
LRTRSSFTFEDQIFKGLAMVAPYTKMIAWARSPLAAAMVGKTIGRHVEESSLPIYIEPPTTSAWPRVCGS